MCCSLPKFKIGLWQPLPTQATYHCVVSPFTPCINYQVHPNAPMDLAIRRPKRHLKMSLHSSPKSRSTSPPSPKRYRPSPSTQTALEDAPASEPTTITVAGLRRCPRGLVGGRRCPSSSRLRHGSVESISTRNVRREPPSKRDCRGFDKVPLPPPAQLTDGITTDGHGKRQNPSVSGAFANRISTPRHASA